MIALAAALSIAVSATVRLDVPYVPQTPSLCGGAAAAMVFRYWGDRHANAEPFAALVDRAAGGIATDRLVEAIRDRRWDATPFTGTFAALHQQLAASHPIILLLEDHPNAYHYVVAVGDDADRHPRARSRLGPLAASCARRARAGVARVEFLGPARAAHGGHTPGRRAGAGRRRRAAGLFRDLLRSHAQHGRGGDRPRWSERGGRCAR